MEPQKTLSFISKRIEEFFLTSKNAISTIRRDRQNGNLGLHLDEEGEPLEEHEVRMIRGIFQLDKTIAREIMTPRVDMTTAELSTSIEEVARVMLTHGHSKIPVYKTNMDKIEGIAYSMDILRIMSNFDNSKVDLANFLRPVLFIPESKTLEDLLTDFQEKHLQMAIVVDEYGGVSGLVTVEDIVEEIVGEIHDEFDRGAPRMKFIGNNQFHVDASISIDDLKDQIGASFEGEGFDTLGGFVLHQLGKIPSAGDSLYYNGIHIQITSTSGRRLRSLRLTLPQDQLEEGGLDK